MELRELLRRRRMVRAFRDEPVDPATLERIVGVIGRAPSAGFSQGQRLDLLGLPDEIGVACVLTVGHPAADEGPDRSSRATRPRRPIEELVRWNRWSS